MHTCALFLLFTANSHFLRTNAFVDLIRISFIFQVFTEPFMQVPLFNMN